MTFNVWLELSSGSKYNVETHPDDGNERQVVETWRDRLEVGFTGLLHCGRRNGSS